MINFFKWLALVLVFFNIAYFVWAIMEPSKNVALEAVSELKEQGVKLKLLDELTEDERIAFLETNEASDLENEQDPESAEKVASEASKQEVLIATEPYCPSLGPFDKKTKLKEVGQRLADAGLKVEARTVLVDSNEKFRVYLPVYADREQAAEALKKLRAKKIDSYIMSDELLNNAISLGIFSNKDSAEGLVKKMLSHGYQAKIQSVRLDTETYWLDISDNISSPKVDDILISVMSEVDGITRIDSPCKVVALVE